jgi:hypothetical protein
MRTRLLLAFLILAPLGIAKAAPLDEARIWTVTLREADGEQWCEATALGQDKSGQMYSIAFRWTDAGVDLVLSYDGDASTADRVGISLDQRQAASLAVAVRGAMERDYLGQSRSQPTVIAPISAAVFKRTIAPAMLRARTLTVQLGPRRFEMTTHQFDDTLGVLARCQAAMRRSLQ